MDDQSILRYFIEHLGRSENPDDLIMEICQRTGRSWNDVEALLEQVRLEHDQKIVRRLTPVLTAIAIVTFAAGIGLMAYCVSTLAAAYHAYVPPSSTVPDILDAILLTILASLPVFGFGLLGLGMALGSLHGMRDVWAAILRI